MAKAAALLCLGSKGECLALEPLRHLSGASPHPGAWLTFDYNGFDRGVWHLGGVRERFWMIA